MKRKYVALILSAVLTTGMIAGCGNSDTASSASSASSESVSSASSESASSSSAENVEASVETIYGQVTSVKDSTITMDQGTLSDTSDTSTFEADGESVEVTVTDDTEFTFAGMGGDMNGDMNMNGQGGQAADQNGQMNPQTGNSADTGSSDTTQTPPDKPDGESGTSSDSTQTPPDMPEGQGGTASDSAQTPPDMPEGQGGTTGDTTQTPPDMPDGQGGTTGDTTQTPPDMPDGQNGTASGSTQAPSGMGQQNGEGQAPSDMGQMGDMTLDISSISEGDLISVTYDETGAVTTITILSSASMPEAGNGGMGNGGMGGGNMGGGMGGSSNANIEYSAVSTYDEDTEVDGDKIESTGSDENAVLVKSGTVSLDNVTVSRDSDDSTGGDNSSFYGVGAAVLSTGGTLNISNAEINTDSAGGAGVFAYGDSTVYVSDTTITTKQDTSGGIHAAGGGTLYATNVTATTNGNSSAAIRSDRGGGTMVVDGGSYTSNGTGSPAIYSTADIAVKDADLTANGSEAICIEGLNSIHLYDCNLTGNMSDDSQNDCTWNVILYQSMSGDSEVGNSTFEMDGGTLTAKNGGMFYTTNTESTFILDDVDIVYPKENDFFLRCTGNNNQRGWGTSGSNGADCSFTAIDQTMEGDVIWDSISTLDFYMTGSSTLTGAFVDDESCAGKGGDGCCTLNLGKESSWIVTGDSTLTTLNTEGTIKDASGKTVTIKGTDGTVYVNGTSEYTITVTNYSTSCDNSGAGTTTTFESYTGSTSNNSSNQ